MCGIAGFAENSHFQSPEGDRERDRALVHRMCEAIRHRGPDDEGIHVEQGVGLGMRRLSIIDLSTGHQPIHNEDRTVWLVFNGEIYNYRELRRELEAAGHVFYTSSDTETIVHAYEEWGEASFNKLRGMFGIALWDRRRKTLLLARDRAGIKPLHFVENGSPVHLRLGNQVPDCGRGRRPADRHGGAGPLPVLSLRSPRSLAVHLGAKAAARAF